MSTVKELVAIWRSGNGRRWVIFYLIPLASLAVVSVVVTIISTYILWGKAQYQPLGDYPVQQVLNRIAEFGEEPALRLGEPLKVRAIKCTTVTEGFVPIAGVLYVVSRDADKPRQYFLLSRGEGLRIPGCQVLMYDNVMPEGVTPGKWRLEGFESARRGAVEQLVPYISEDFLVLPRSQ